MTRIVCALLFLCFVIAQPSGVSAQGTQTTNAIIGTIAEIEGTAAIAHGEETLTPEIGHGVYLNDIIETGADSKLLVLFIDDTELVVGENARMSVDEYVFDADTPEQNKGVFSVMRGPFVFVSGLLSKLDNEPDVKIETAYGSIGIRGTVVWGGAIDDEYNVFVQEGEVTFATNRGRVTIGPGKGTSVYSKNAIPGRARQWDETRVNLAKKTVSLKRIEDVKKRVAETKEKHRAMRETHRDNREKLHEKVKEEKQERREKRMENMREYHPQKPEPPEIHDFDERHDNMHDSMIERMEDRHEERKENRTEQIEQRQEMRPETRSETRSETRQEARQEARQEIRAADSAADFERNEKSHLEQQHRAQPAQKNSTVRDRTTRRTSASGLNR